MKKIYSCPRAEKLTFMYEENITASNPGSTPTATRCADPCSTVTNQNPWWCRK